MRDLCMFLDQKASCGQPKRLFTGLVRRVAMRRLPSTVGLERERLAGRIPAIRK
jgi:hypothetical protein